MKTFLIIKLGLLSLIMMSIIMTSCNQQKSRLYIKTVTVIGIDENQVETDTITIINSDYFEIGLYLGSSEEPSFITKKDVIKPTSIENYKAVLFRIVQEDGNDIIFKSSTEFLNFMSKRGYEMIDQLKSK